LISLIDPCHSPTTIADHQHTEIISQRHVSTVRHDDDDVEHDIVSYKAKSH